MSITDLYQEWHDGQPGIRPLRAKHYREELAELAGERPPRQLSDLEQWLRANHKRLGAAIERAAREEIDDLGGADVYLEIGETAGEADDSDDEDADDEPPHACELCGDRFHTEDGVAIHRGMMHPDADGAETGETDGTDSDTQED